MKFKSRSQTAGERTTMDRAGRITIPLKIRRQSGIELGVPVEVRLENGEVIINCDLRLTKLEKRGRLLVGIPSRNTPSLSMKVVERTRRKLRKQR